MKKKSTKKTSISIKNIVKRYTVHHEKPTLIENLVSRSRTEQFFALKGIDLDIYPGESVGIIGANGSGKTTLLKTIVGITTPSSGSVRTEGKVVSIIDFEAGFHPDLTGVENIYLNGLIIGMTKKEIAEKFDDIATFADIGNFLDAPLFSYSQGMKLRLGFSVAVHADPDILILDESINAGDEKFQKKALDRIQTFFRKNKTVLVVSHWLEFLKKNCDRIIWLDKGVVIRDGGLEVIREYAARMKTNS